MHQESGRPHDDMERMSGGDFMQQQISPPPQQQLPPQPFQEPPQQAFLNDQSPSPRTENASQ